MSLAMGGAEIGLGALTALLALLAAGMPIGPALITVSFAGLWLLKGWSVAAGALGLIPYHFAANWALSALPMFILLGQICHHGQLTDGLFRAARAWLAPVPGGLALASVLGATGFAAMCGSSVACSATIGRIAIPQMLKAGYDARLATACVAVAGTIGALIPPSIVLILYGVVAQVPVTDLFLGGIGAGLLTAIGYVAVIVVRVRLDPGLAPPAVPGTRAERLAALGATWPVLAMIVTVLGGLFGGLFTPTEAGAVGAVAAVAIAAWKGTLSWQGLMRSLTDTAFTTCTLMLIGVGASLLARLLTVAGTGAVIADAVATFGSEPTALILVVALVYLFLGLFLEPIGILLITLPIILPVVSQAGLDLVWFGVIVAKLLEIGMITPPMGLNIFVIKGTVGDLVPAAAIFRGVLWFIAADLCVVAMLIWWPDIILLLPVAFG